MTRTSTFSLVVAALALTSVVASGAVVDPMAAFYGNVAIVKDQGTGYSGTLQLNSDHTYLANVTDGGRQVIAAGVWQLGADGRTVCLTSTAPIHANPVTVGCSSYGGHTVGDHWSVTNDRNQQLDIRLEPAQ